MCKRCGKNLGALEIVIKISETQEERYCPNCTLMQIEAGELHIPRGSYISELSGQDGAVQIFFAAENDNPFVLTPDEAIRLLGYNLKPEEYLALLPKHKDDFLIHDDFYDEDGTAICPVCGP